MPTVPTDAVDGIRCQTDGWGWPLALRAPPRPKQVGGNDAVFLGRVGMWRGGCRLGLAVAAPFVWRCLNIRTMTPFPHPSHRTGRADFPHPALGQDITPTPTAGHAPSDKDERDPWSRRHTRVDSPRTHAV